MIKTMDLGEIRRDWRTLIGATVAVTISTPGLIFYTLGVMMPFLIESAGRTREEISAVQFMFSAIVAIAAPAVGALMDRFGVLRVATFSLFMEAAGFVLLGASAEFLPMFALSMAMLALFGLGTTPLGYGRIVSATFDKNRGLALGFMVSGLGILATVSPIALNWIISATDWRMGYYAIATMVLVLGGSGILILSSARKRSGEHYGKRSSEGGNWHDLRRPVFWFIILGFCLPAVFGGGYVVHLISAMREKGMTMQDAVQVQAVVGASILVSRLLSGAALDRFSAASVAGLTFAISGVGTFLLGGGPLELLMLAAFAMGLTVGAELDIMAYVISRKFGVQNFTRLYGLAYGLLVITGGVSPLMVALFHTHFGSFDIPYMIGSLGLLAGAAVTYFSVRSIGGPEPVDAPRTPDGVPAQESV